MPVLIDTATVQAGDRFDAWAETSARVFEPLEVSSPASGDFAARLERHVVGDFSIDLMSVERSTARRTGRLIRASDPEELKLMLQLDGVCTVEQDERTCKLRPGEFTTWSSSRPYVVAGETRFEVLLLHCPRHSFTSSSALDRPTATAITGNSPTGQIVTAYLTALLDGLSGEGLHSAAGVRLAGVLPNLIEALHLGDERASPPAPPRSDRLRAQVSRYVEARLGDPTLTVEQVARAHFISRSYLNRLYAEQGGLWRLVRARRLAGARQELADPERAEDSILSVVSRWGFISAAHFSRAFRERYGCTPSEFRRISR